MNTNNHQESTTEPRITSMSNFQAAKKQGNMSYTYSGEEKVNWKLILSGAQILDLANKDFKAVFIQTIKGKYVQRCKGKSGLNE